MPRILKANVRANQKQAIRMSRGKLVKQAHNTSHTLGEREIKEVCKESSESTKENEWVGEKSEGKRTGWLWEGR